jgi:dihydrolipoamide dehydrogenase
MADYDIVVLGGGPGGYATALYAASAGLSVALVEANKVGGTCLHRGCIPAKALLHAAEVFRTVNHAAEHGVKVGGAVEPDWPAANKRKAGIVGNLHKGLQGLLKRRKVTVVTGWGRLTADGAVAVTTDDGAGSSGGTQTLSGRAVVICAGSAPRAIPGMDVDGVTVITSDQSTNSDAEKLPERVAVIGGGVIGAEFASVFTDMGVATTLLEALPNPILPLGPDRDVANVLAKSLTRRGLTVHGEARVGTLEHTSAGVVVPFETPKGSDKIEVDQVLVSIGRRPVTEDIGAAEAGVRVTDRGFVDVDRTTMLTSRPGVYAVGDCVDTPGLAHIAYAEGVLAVQHFLGENPVPIDYAKVPWVVYTHPEVAWSGLTEAAAREAYGEVDVHKHSMAGNGRAMILGETDGLVKVVARKDGPVVGFHMVGPWASELMHEGYLAVNWEALPAEVGHLIHAHPSLSEAIGETMITFSGRSLHG